MLIFFTDESLVQGNGSKPYGLSIYGGLVLSEIDFRDLTKFLYKLKENYVYPQELDLKWRFASVWENMKKIGYLDKKITKANDPDLYNSLKEDYDKLKAEIIQQVAKSNAKIILAIRPNKLLNASSEQVIDYSIQAVSRKFEKLLEREGEFGLILADELQPRLKKEDVINYQYILELCHLGSGQKAFERVINIVPTIDSCISPIHQINDIILGVMQYYMLEFMRRLEDDSYNIDQANKLLLQIKDNFYKASSGGYIINSGILLYPPKINRQSTRAGAFLNKLEDQLKRDFNIN